MAGTQGSINQRPPRIVAARGLTDGDGNITFAFDPPFDSDPVVTVSVGRNLGPGNNAAYFHKISSTTPSEVTVHLDQSISVTVLGLGVLAVQTPASGFTISIIAMEGT